MSTVSPAMKTIQKLRPRFEPTGGGPVISSERDSVDSLLGTIEAAASLELHTVSRTCQ